MLAQEGEDGSEHVVYYLSKKLEDYEMRYTTAEKSCFALVWAIQKLRHILLSYQILVIAQMDPLKYLFGKLALTSKLSKWLILLADFDLTYVAKNTIKGRVVDAKKLSRLTRLRPPLGSTDLDLCFVLVCEHIMETCTCVCVCVLWHIYGYGNGEEKHEVWSRHQVLGN